MVQNLRQMATYYEMPYVKLDDTKRNSDFKWQTGGKQQRTQSIFCELEITSSKNELTIKAAVW